MKEKSDKFIEHKTTDGAIMNFVSRQAQEAKLDPNLPETYKDDIVGAAVGTILRIAEKKNAYNVPRAENRQIQEPRTIYDSRDDEERPEIISEINEYLKEVPAEDMEAFTVEGMAFKIGINKRTLYEWVKSDQEFSDNLETIQKAQKNDPYKTGAREDIQVNAMMIAINLVMTKNRHYKSNNL